MEYRQIGLYHKKLLMLQVVRFCVQNFAQGEPPASSRHMAGTLGLPLSTVKGLLEELVACGILFRVASPAEGYTPARDIEHLTVMDVLTAFENMGDKPLPLDNTLEIQVLEQSLKEFEQAARQSPGEQNLKEI